MNKHCWTIFRHHGDRVEIHLQCTKNLTDEYHKLCKVNCENGTIWSNVEGVENIHFNRHSLILYIAFMYKERYESIIKEVEYRLGLNDYSGETIGQYSYDADAHIRAMTKPIVPAESISPVSEFKITKAPDLHMIKPPDINKGE